MPALRTRRVRPPQVSELRVQELATIRRSRLLFAFNHTLMAAVRGPAMHRHTCLTMHKHTSIAMRKTHTPRSTSIAECVRAVTAARQGPILVAATTFGIRTWAVRRAPPLACALGDPRAPRLAFAAPASTFV